MLRDIKPFQFIYWLVIALFIILFTYLLVKLFPLYNVVVSILWKVLSPFLIACFIAYLLYPVIQKLHHYNIHKAISILLIYILFFGGMGFLIYRLYPVAIRQLGELNEQLPQLIAMYEHAISNLYQSTSFLPEAVHDQIDQLIIRVETSLENRLGKLMGGFTKIFDLIVLLTVIPVLVFYILKDYHKITEFVKKFIPLKYKQRSSKLMHAIDERLGGYIRGQLLVSLFVSFTTLITFHLLHVKYALLLAIIMGLTNFIPYFGPIIGSIPVVAITMTESTKLVIIVLIAIFIIQLVESNLLSPYIVGKSINIHPIAIIFALLLGGQLSGVIGMIMAVPILTIMKEITSHLIAFRVNH